MLVNHIGSAVCIGTMFLLVACDTQLSEAFDTDLDDSKATSSDLVKALARAKRDTPEISFYIHRRSTNPAKKAQALINDGFTVRNNPTLYPVPPIDWAANPRDDSNWLFQKNALYFAAPFFQSHIESDREEYLRVLADLLLDWVKFHNRPLHMNSMQWDDMSTGLRAVYLAYVVEHLLRAEILPISDVATLLESAIEHTQQLADPDKLNKNNHAYFQLLGLTALCRVLPQMKGCSEHLVYASEQMERLFLSQFSAEGIQREHSPGYHIYSLRRANAIQETQWFDLSPEAHRRLELARQNVKYLKHPNGWDVMVGDTERRAGRLLMSLNRSVESSQLSGFFEKSGIAVLGATDTQQDPRSGSYVFFWAGEEQPGHTLPHSHSHSHADNFTFEWSEAGIPVLIDSGKYGYDNDKWRKFFLSTRAHNTVEIDHQSYANAIDVNDPSKHSFVPRISAFNDGPPLQFINAETKHYRSNVTHQRIIVTKPQQWLVVVDKLRGLSNHQFTQWFHFEEQWNIQKINERVFHGRRGDKKLHIVSLVDNTSGSLYHGQIDPLIQGWVSPKYLQRLPRYTVGMTSSGHAFVFASLFVWEPESNIVPTATVIETEEDNIHICWQYGDLNDGFNFSDNTIETDCSGSTPE